MAYTAAYKRCYLHHTNTKGMDRLHISRVVQLLVCCSICLKLPETTLTQIVAISLGYGDILRYIDSPASFCLRSYVALLVH